MQIQDAPSFRPEFDMFIDSFEELIVVELKSPLYFECLYYLMCFEFEIPNKAKYKNKNEIVEDREIEPELEKVEEPVTVSAS
jgi:hypothetical protein